ncbi:MAG: U32 family peptidase, partial [Clostridia bacterium]|nr:U32 family peptidase [Clostridia bacterium]
MRTGKLPELLAPAGSMESLRAALAAGADAVYFGSTAFSNRMRAKNFENSTMADTLRLIHSCGAKAYVTVNTRVRDRETRELDELLASILGGPETCDAVICADFGAAARIRETYPDAVLHASTQTSLSCPADGEVLKSLGFTRLVVPRELSLSEIREIADKSPLEVEMFIHGAHCVSLSGQCLMSYFMGGRSGNRGECAQPCRLPYQKDGKSGYPISLADMCLAGRITDVIASGAASLKIEGRLKSAPYVYGVTKIYRTLLDEGRNATKKEIDALAALFTRGFTDGFFTGAYSAMSGGKGEESNKQTFADEIRTRLGQRIDRVSRERRTSSDGKLPLKASFVMTENAPVTLTLTCGKLTASVSGTEPQPASGAPASPDSVGKNLMKMGGTSYTLAMEDIDFSIGDGLFLPVSEINRLRRDAVL